MAISEDNIVLGYDACAVQVKGEPLFYVLVSESRVDNTVHTTAKVIRQVIGKHLEFSSILPVATSDSYDELIHHIESHRNEPPFEGAKVIIIDLVKAVQEL